MQHRHIWLGGWGVSPETVPERLRPAFPGADITVLPPTRENLEHALASPKETALGGWSLGARLLLEEASKGHPGLGGRPAVTLVCPFLAFPSEAGQGGRVTTTQVKFLRRWLGKDPTAALGDFYQRAGLNLPAPVAPPYPVADLDAGLDLLADPTPVELPSSTFPGRVSFRFFAGENDPLVNNTRLAELLPGLKIVSGAGHDLADFVREIN